MADTRWPMAKIEKKPGPLMKLWQYMLAGCDRREQAYDALFDQDGDMLKSCAMGAAIEARYKPETNERMRANQNYYLSMLRKEYPILCENFDWRLAESPQDDEPLPLSLEAIILDANDKHHWTRERIALEIVKPKEEAEDVDGTS